MGKEIKKISKTNKGLSFIFGTSILPLGVKKFTEPLYAPQIGSFKNPEFLKMSFRGRSLHRYHVQKILWLQMYFSFFR